MKFSIRVQPGDWNTEDMIIVMLPCGIYGARREGRKEKVLTRGPILSTRMPVRGASMYSMNIDTEPSQDMSDSDLCCNIFAL